jgi:hypothetical protein
MIRFLILIDWLMRELQLVAILYGVDDTTSLMGDSYTISSTAGFRDGKAESIN